MLGLYFAFGVITIFVIRISS